MSARWFACSTALLTLALACQSAELTQMVVVVDSDSDDFDRVVLSFVGLARRAPLEIDLRRQPLPRHVTLVHDGGPLGPFGVTVSAFEPGADEPALVEPRTQLFFERGRARMLKIDLLQECVDNDCPIGQACLEGPRCVPSSDGDATRLRPWDGEVDPLGIRSEVDGGMDLPDVGVPDSGATDSGTIRGPMPAPTFPYPPSNFDPLAELIPAGRAAIVLDCPGQRPTFDSSTMSFSDSCAEEPFAAPIEQSAGGAAVLLVMDTLSITAGTTLRLVGTQPVILAVYGDAHLFGGIDASAEGATPGAGGNIDCGAAAGAPGAVVRSGPPGAGGGAGGGFGSAGGQGGGSSTTPPAAGGSTLGTAQLSPLRGGCPGGDGGLGDGASAAPGGAGGGALQISAAGQLDVRGWIAANGGGGAATATLRDGGGGGGSGGAILLEGDRVIFDSAALVVANGGGGGGGNATAGDSRASAGSDAGRTTAAAIGGEGPNSGGRGGSGASRAVSAEDGEDAELSLVGEDYGAGGGGGGGVGRIVVHPVDPCVARGTFSPALMNECTTCTDCMDLPSPRCQVVMSGAQSYVYCTENVSWSDAQASCASVGLSLVEVDDDVEQGFLVGLAVQYSWLGARDAAVEGEWSWDRSGQPFWSEQLRQPVGGAYADWAQTQPDSDPGDQDCMAESQFGWIDYGCTEVLHYFCEP